MDKRDRDLIRALPKVELHVHLEGSIQPTTLLKLAKRNGVDLGFHTEAQMRLRYQFRDIDHFMRLYEEMTFALRQPEDFRLIAYEYGITASAQGIRYAEVTFTADTHFRLKGIPFDEMIDAVWQGAAAAAADTGIRLRFVIDHIRGLAVEACFRTAEWCIAGRDRGVVALGMSGREAGFPASLYGEAIVWAQAHGVPFVPHAGEVTESGDIWDVLQFKPARI